jgi:hypothetical protein
MSEADEEPKWAHREKLIYVNILNCINLTENTERGVLVFRFDQTPSDDMQAKLQKALFQQVPETGEWTAVTSPAAKNNAERLAREFGKGAGNEIAR